MFNFVNSVASDLSREPSVFFAISDISAIFLMTSPFWPPNPRFCIICRRHVHKIDWIVIFKNIKTSRRILFSYIYTIKYQANQTMEKIAPSKIVGVQFSMLSPEEIRRNSVVEITSRDTYINNKPCINGLFDVRMGVMENSMICPTDGHNYLNCPGYFGHIELAKPVFFIQHLKEVIKICRCICFACSKLLINKNQHKHVLDMTGEDRWEYVSNLASNVKRCGEKTDDGCGCKQPSKITLEGMTKIIAKWDKMGNNTEPIAIHLYPELILKMLKRITDEDIYFMGFNPKWSRPEWMICQVLPIAPQSCRPSVKQDAQQRSEDDLTHIYSNIIKYNKTLQEKISNNAPANVIEGWTLILQHSIAMIYNNKMKGISPMAQRSGRPLKCIIDRINSKNGRIRGNLMGKRVDFSARTVITGDPNLSIQEIGIPMKIAKNLTKPVVVNKRNHNFLLKLVQNGPDHYPGAKILERSSGENISLKHVNRGLIQLNYGDIVHRHLLNGDAILFNRQPSLHRLSMMCHIVRVMPVGDSFRMNVADTVPYNADFDGDEMNAHMAQNIMAEIELRHLAAIPYQQVSPTNNAPIIGIFQDSLLGSYRFTRKNISFSHRDAMNLLMSYKNVDTQLFENRNKPITNFEILSQIFPPITLKRNTGLFQDGEDSKTSNNVLEIKTGKYIRGQLEKATIKSTTKGILHRIFNDFGPFACANFNDDLQAVVTEYMKTSSFSVGISDLIANTKTNNQIVEIIHKQKQIVQSIIDKVHLGIFENNTAYSNFNEFENMVNNTLNKATEESGKVGRKSLNPDNRFIMIVESGSKGSLINISQMLCCLGQQNVDGKRIPYGFDSRTLPHFTKYDDSPNARGFIENSFISGLTAPELFFHAMAGRMGLIDTAVKSVVGETPIVILENGQPLYVEIGKWIDEKINGCLDKVERMVEKNMELLNLDKDEVYIPTTDEKGVVTWGQLTAVTRHDPGDRLYEIKTLGGRNVTVADSESLLVWRNETKEFLKIHSKDVKVGDFVPVCASLTTPPVIKTSIPIDDHISKTDFMLNEENGIFVGLFLAGGNLTRESINITNNNDSIRKFVKHWFSKHGMKFEERIRVNNKGYKTTTIRGHSTIMATFFKELMKNGSSNKHVPHEAFVASDEFVVGLLNGYFSGDGRISKNSIEVSSASSKLIDGIAMLLSRLGIFGNRSVLQLRSNNPTTKNIHPVNRLRICSHWGRAFAEKIPLLEESKQRKLKSIQWTQDHPNFAAFNDVVLDEITCINILGTENHPKLYDVTVPSTLNFGIANGLMLRDTSATGYIQRRLIKGLEDLKVEYDMTVRNSKGKIIQYSYGDDHFDSTKIENQNIPLISMSVEEVYAHYDIPGITDNDNSIFLVFDENARKRMKQQQKATLEMTKQYIDKMLVARDDIIRHVFKYKNDNMVRVPVAFAFIIGNIQGQLQLNANSSVDITPLEAFELIQQYYKKLRFAFYIKPTPLFEILYYFYFNPKELLLTKRFSRKGLILLLETVILKFKEAVVHPGEMVGIIGGQAIGEPSTQLTLNTFHNTGSATKSNVTRGVPRIEEILRLTKNPKNPSMTIYLKPIEQNNQDKASKYSNIINHTKLIDVVKAVQIYYDPMDEMSNIEEDHAFIAQFKEFETMFNNAMTDENRVMTDDFRKSKWIVRIELNAETMLDKNISMDDIHFAISNSVYSKDVRCIYSDYNADNLIFRIRLSTDIFGKKRLKTLESLDQSDEIYILKNFQDSLLNNIVLRGITGIRNVVPRKLQNSVQLEGDKYVAKECWLLDTTGSNLLDTLALDFIDYTRTVSNDIKEVFDILGIEAARQVIFNELTDVFEFNGDVYINYHHLSLLCDRMTCNKNMVAIFRFKSGLMNDDTGPLSKSTFEVHTEVLLNASRHAEFDNMRGVSANIMCGQMGHFGTSAFNVLIDKSKYDEIEKEEDRKPQPDVKLSDFLDKPFAPALESKTMCDKKYFVLHNNISNLAKKEEVIDAVCDDDYNMGF